MIYMYVFNRHFNYYVQNKKNVKDHKKEIYINTYEFLFMEFFRYWLLPLKLAQY